MRMQGTTLADAIGHLEAVLDHQPHSSGRIWTIEDDIAVFILMCSLGAYPETPTALAPPDLRKGKSG